MTAVFYALGVILFALGVIMSIALHEVGHMWPAKKFGVKVPRYFVGFGKTVWSIKRGDTEYGVKMFPVGGFVQLSGMLPPAKRDAEGRAKTAGTGFFGRMIADARAAEYEKIGPQDQDRLFYQRVWWKKVIVMAGGPMVNVLLAIIFLTTVFVGFGIPQTVPRVDTVYDCVIPASSQRTTCAAGDKPSPAVKAGLRHGDMIVSVDGKRLSSWTDIQEAIRSRPNRSVAIGVVRNGRALTLHTVLARNTQIDLTDPTKYVRVGYLGMLPSEQTKRQSVGFVFTTMGDYTQRTGSAIVDLPGRMVGVFKAALGVQKRDVNSPMSVVGASRVAGEVASEPSVSWVDRAALLLQLLGVINLFIALFNFIPLLPLDGGHIAGALYEAARRGLARLRGRPDPGYADVAKMLPIAYTMAAVLLVMGVVLIWADIVNPITLRG